jgi:hypothetical protein
MPRSQPVKQHMKKPKHAARSAKSDAVSSAADNSMSAENAEPRDALAFLKEDADTIDALFGKFEAAQHQQAQGQIAKELSRTLRHHVRLMEDVVYPELRLHGVDEDELERAQVKLDGIKMLVNDIAKQQPDAPYYKAKIAVLAENMKQHAREQHTDDFFAAARKAGADMKALGRKLQAHKSELTEKAESNRLEPLQTRSLGFSDQQEKGMTQGRYGQDRQRERYQDDDDDDRLYSQGGGHRGRASRGQDHYDQQHRTGPQDYRDDDYRSQQHYGGGRARQSEYGSGDYEGYGQREQYGQRARGQYDQPDQYEQRGRYAQSGRYGQSEEYGQDQGRFGRDQQDYGYGRQEHGYRGERYGRTDEYRQTRGGMQRGQGGWQNEDQERYGEGRSSSERYGYDEDRQRYSSPYRERAGQSGYEGGGQRGYRQTGYEDDYDDRRARSRSRTQDDDTNQTRRGRNGNGSRVSTF